jgi:hypothetical protein
MSYLLELCLFEHSGVQCIYILYIYIYVCVCFCIVFLRFVYPMLPVSLDCPFLIVPSVFSNVYLRVSYQSELRPPFDS